MPSRRIAVFVDGCFWHGCPEHGRKGSWSGPNAALWEEKMQRNKERDERSSRLAEELGWEVVRVWECVVKDQAPAVAEDLVAQVPRTGGRPQA